MHTSLLYKLDLELFERDWTEVTIDTIWKRLTLSDGSETVHKELSRQQLAVLRVLRLFSFPATTKEISERSKVKATDVHIHLSTLVRIGIVEPRGGQVHALTDGTLLYLGSMFSLNDDIVFVDSDETPTLMVHADKQEKP